MKKCLICKQDENHKRIPAVKLNEFGICEHCSHYTGDIQWIDFCSLTLKYMKDLENPHFISARDFRNFNEVTFNGKKPNHLLINKPSPSKLRFTFMDRFEDAKPFTKLGIGRCLELCRSIDIPFSHFKKALETYDDVIWRIMNKQCDGLNPMFRTELHKLASDQMKDYFELHGIEINDTCGETFFLILWEAKRRISLRWKDEYNRTA